MSQRALFVLGTASQVPTRHRNHNGYLLRWDGHGLLFDPGEGTQRQLSRYGLSASSVTRILVSHFHGDHCLGLPGIVQRLSLDEVGRPVDVHFPASGQKYFDRLRKASIFVDKLDTPERPIAGDGVVYEDEEVVLSAKRLRHPVETYGFRLEERAGRRMLPDALEEKGVRGRVISELMRDGSVTVAGRTVRIEEVSVPRRGQVFAFVMDTAVCDAAVALAEGADLLVCESTFLSSHAAEAEEYGHLTAAQAARMAADAGVRRLVLTHFSQRYPDTEAFLEEARPIHEDCVAVKDGDVVELPKRRS